MSDVSASAAVTPAPATTAGGLLRQARQAQGLHIAALAAAIKVVPRKLELLESDQFDQLPDATFTRALAQTMCRTLKVDAAPILALLPPVGDRLQHASGGLNTPFRERAGRPAPREWTSASPVLWLAALIVIAAFAVYVVPTAWLPSAELTPAPAPVEVSAAPPPVSEAVPIAAPEIAASAAAAATEAASGVVAPAAAEAVVVAAAPVSGALQLRTTAQSWVEVTDARGQALLARLVEPGETLAFDGQMPLKLRIGNAAGTQVVFRGQPLELAAFTRDNVARLELK